MTTSREEMNAPAPSPEDPNPRAQIGGNNPPDPMIPITTRVRERLNAVSVWLTNVKEIVSAEAASRLEDFLIQLRGEYAKTKEDHAALKKPFMDEATRVDDDFRPLLEELAAAAGLLKPLKEGWLAKERNRLAAEANARAAEAREAQRLADVAAEKLKPKPVAGLTMVPVVSSNVKEIGYEAVKRELHIVFTSGYYKFADVPAELHADMMKSPSVGAFFALNIKGKYVSTKMMAQGITAADVVAADTAAKAATEAVATATVAQAAKPQVRSELTGRASGFRTTWKAKIVDLKLAADHYLTDTRGKIALTEAIQKLANADAKAMKDKTAIPGIKAAPDEAV